MPQYKLTKNLMGRQLNVNKNTHDPDIYLMVYSSFSLLNWKRKRYALRWPFRLQNGRIIASWCLCSRNFNSWIVGRTIVLILFRGRFLLIVVFFVWFAIVRWAYSTILRFILPSSWTSIVISSFIPHFFVWALQ